MTLKQYSKITYLGFIHDESLSVESMVIHVINKRNSSLRFNKIDYLIFLYLYYYALQ